MTFYTSQSVIELFLILLSLDPSPLAVRICQYSIRTDWDLHHL